MEQSEVSVIINIINSTDNINNTSNSNNNNNNACDHHHQDQTVTKPTLLHSLTRFHAGYFRISLSLCGQALLWKVLVTDAGENPHALRRIFLWVPQTAFSFLWSLALFALASQSLLYSLRCVFRPRAVKGEFLHRVGVNYLFAPWISWLLLLQSSPFISPESIYYHVLWWVFAVPIVVLDVKIYGQWLTKGKRFLSAVANPASHLSVIGNLVAARAAAEMGWHETALCMFAFSAAHYLVVFVTLYQRLSGNELPAKLRPVYFLFVGAPGMASLAWCSIAGEFDVAAKMFFFLSLFLFMSLVSRPALFTKAMRKFHVAWWGYSFPVTVLALASVEYAEEVKLVTGHAMMIVLAVFSFLLCFALIVATAFHSNMLLPDSLNTPIDTDSKPTRCDII